jgi:hypothetical protein
MGRNGVGRGTEIWTEGTSSRSGKEDAKRSGKRHPRTRGRRGKRRTPRGGTSRERGERNTDFKTDREGRGIVQGLESIIVQGLKTRNKGLGYIGVKLRVQGAGCRVWGIGLRVKG